MPINKSFDKIANHYDAWIKKALPCFEDIFSVSTEIIPFKQKAKIRVLDLGAGTGLFSKVVFEKYPKADFVLYDLAVKMLEVAKKRFSKNINQFDFIVDDYINLKKRKLEKFDLVISSLSIHHLRDADKKRLFKDIFDILKDKGVFINLDEIKGETKYIRNLYQDTWLRQVRQKVVSEAKLQASIKRRRKYDKDSLLVDQLKWLKQAGFKTVDIVYKNYFVGVFFARKN